MIWLGVDLGSRRIGLAVSDEDGETARPEATRKGEPGKEAALVRAAAADFGAKGVVLGLPLDMSGAEGLAARRARRIAAELQRLEPGLTVALFDERLTSKAAERALSASGRSARDQRGEVDRVAATMLLQTFLDARRRRGAT